VSDAYLGEHIRDALAHDPSVGELDIHVTVAGTRIVLTGNVADGARLAAIDTVVAQLDLGGHAVSNCVTVMTFTEPDERELLS
jgi:osmotically-inducible protein OsmY